MAIEKANQAKVYEAISADTGVDTAHIKAFMESKGISDPSDLAGNEALLVELMESGKGALTTAAPSKPATKRGGRKPKQANAHPLAVAAQRSNEQYIQLRNGVEAGAVALGEEWGNELTDIVMHTPIQTAINRVAENAGEVDPAEFFRIGEGLFDALISRSAEDAAA